MSWKQNPHWGTFTGKGEALGWKSGSRCERAGNSGMRHSRAFGWWTRERGPSINGHASQQLRSTVTTDGVQQQGRSRPHNRIGYQMLLVSTSVNGVGDGDEIQFSIKYACRGMCLGFIRVLQLISNFTVPSGARPALLNAPTRKLTPVLPVGCLAVFTSVCRMTTYEYWIFAAR